MTIYFPLRLNSGEPLTDTFTYPNSKTIIYSRPNETIKYNYNDKGQIESNNMEECSGISEEDKQAAAEQFKYCSTNLENGQLVIIDFLCRAF